jgi:hypothetical protein
MTRLQDIIEETRAETPEEDEEAAEAEEAETTPETPDDDDAQTAQAMIPDADPNALEKESKRHEKALAKALGAAWEGAQPCEACGALGFLPAGFEPPPPVMNDPDVVACDACNGWGQRATPSLNPQYASIPCTDCNGWGYKSRQVYEAEQGMRAAQYAPLPVVPPPVPVWDASINQYVDQFGQPLQPVAFAGGPSVNGPGTP